MEERSVRRSSMFKQLTIILLVAILTLLVSDSHVAGTQPRCPELELENGRVVYRSRGRVAKFRCRQGFTLVEGDRFATCVRNSWNGRKPKCVRRGCPSIAHPEHGRRQYQFRRGMAIFTCFPGYDLSGFPALSCNSRYWNGTVPSCQVPAHPLLECDFEDDLCGWINSNQDDFDWLRKRGPSQGQQVLMVGVGPGADHTLGTPEGHYMYIEASVPRPDGHRALLFSPVYQFTMPIACFSFFFHNYGSSSGALNIYVKPEDESVNFLPPSLQMSGSSEARWYLYHLNITNKELSNFQIVLEAVRDPDNSDIAIDDVRLAFGSNCYPATTTTPPTTTPPTTTKPPTTTTTPIITTPPTTTLPTTTVPTTTTPPIITTPPTTTIPPTTTPPTTMPIDNTIPNEGSTIIDYGDSTGTVPTDTTITNEDSTIIDYDSFSLGTTIPSEIPTTIDDDSSHGTTIPSEIPTTISADNSEATTVSDELITVPISTPGEVATTSAAATAIFTTSQSTSTADHSYAATTHVAPAIHPLPTTTTPLTTETTPQSTITIVPATSFSSVTTNILAGLTPSPSTTTTTTTNTTIATPPSTSTTTTVATTINTPVTTTTVVPAALTMFETAVTQPISTTLPTLGATKLKSKGMSLVVIIAIVIVMVASVAFVFAGLYVYRFRRQDSLAEDSDTRYLANDEVHMMDSLTNTYGSGRGRGSAF